MTVIKGHIPKSKNVGFEVKDKGINIPVGFLELLDIVDRDGLVYFKVTYAEGSRTYKITTLDYKEEVNK